MKYLSEIAKSIPKLAPPKCRHDKIPWRGCYLAEGDDGKAYENWDDENKVVKVGFLDRSKSGTSLSNLENNFDYVLNNKPEAYVEVYDYGCVDCRACNISYFVLMKKLYPLSNNEANTIPALAIKAQKFSGKNTGTLEQNDFLKSLSDKKQKTFVKNIWDSGIVHNDIFCGNLMKDENGDYKLIDLDRLTLLK